MQVNNLFQQLRRRHVFKAGLAYLFVSWLIVQVLDILADAFALPENLLPFTILLLVLCFPVWLGISWFYDLTEDGIVRTESVEKDEETVSTKSVNLNKVIITSLSITVIVLVLNTFRMNAENKRLNQAGDLTQSEGILIPEYSNSVGVMPFTDLSPEQDYDYFAIGISDEIRDRLNRIEDLKPVFSTKYNQGASYQNIADDLNVGYILEGSVRVSKDLFRITARIIDGSDGSDIWSQTYDREMEDVLFTQHEIAKHVAEVLEVSLRVDDVKLRKVDPEAYLYYSKANRSLKKYSRAGTLEADSLIRLSLDIDDSYSPAWNTLARVVFKKTYYYFLIEPAVGYEKGSQAALKAIDLDDSNAMAYAWLSNFEWQNKEAAVSEKHLKDALDLSPNDPAILFQTARFLLTTNRLEKAKKSLDKAILLDPDNRSALYFRGFLNWTNGDLEEAKDDLLMGYRLGLPQYLKNFEMALLQRDMGNYEAALQWLENEESDYLKSLLQCSIYYAMGRTIESEEILNTIESYSIDALKESSFIDTAAEHYYELACLYAFMGDSDNAFVYLDQAFDHILILQDRLFTNPDFNELKNDPRWEDLLVRLGDEMGYDFIHE